MLTSLSQTPVTLATLGLQLSLFFSFLSHFASKVILGLGAGIAVRNVAWFVFDHGLPLADEARVLSQGSQHQEASEAFVRQLRATFFKCASDPVFPPAQRPWASADKPPSLQPSESPLQRLQSRI